jgi:hypothetical protein
MGERDVEIARLLERFATPRRQGRDLVENRLQVVLRENGLVAHRLEIAVQPHDRRLTELEVHVARARCDHAFEERYELHVPTIGTTAGSL